MLKIDTDASLVTMTRRGMKSLRWKLPKKLNGNTSITKIVIKDNNLNFRAAGKTIEKMFSENFRGAVEVDLSNNGFNSKHVGNMIALMELRMNELDLSGNFFNRKDKMRLAQAARKHPNLTLFLDRLTRS